MTWGTRFLRSAANAAKKVAPMGARHLWAPGCEAPRPRLAMPPGGYESEAKRPKLFIPGPIEFSPEVEVPSQLTVLAAVRGGYWWLIAQLPIEFALRISAGRRSHVSNPAFDIPIPCRFSMPLAVVRGPTRMPLSLRSLASVLRW